MCKICKCPTPGTDKAGKCCAVAGGGGGGGGWAQVELTDALRLRKLLGWLIFSHCLLDLNN